MGTLKCVKCGITAEADNKIEALSKIDHAVNSKKCDGKDENCAWYPNGVPIIKPDGDIDPKRPIEGIKMVATIATKKPALKLGSK